MNTKKINNDSVVMELTNSELATICTALGHLCADCVIGDFPRLYAKSYKLHKYFSNLQFRDCSFYAPYPIQK